jgi:hypothetical protein
MHESSSVGSVTAPLDATEYASPGQLTLAAPVIEKSIVAASRRSMPSSVPAISRRSESCLEVVCMLGVVCTQKSHNAGKDHA